MSALRARARILVVANRFPAASETFVVEHVRGLVKRGWEVGVGCRSVDRPGVRALEEEFGARLPVFDLHPPCDKPAQAVELLRASASSLRVARGARHASGRSASLIVRPLRDCIESWKPRLIHAHFGPNGVAAAWAAEGSRMPVVVDLHGQDLTVAPLLDGWGLYRDSFASTELVVHSAFMQALVHDHLPNRARLIPFGVDGRLFRANERREAWGSFIRLLSVGRAVFQKGHHDAIATLAALSSLRPAFDFGLSVCGSGPHESFLRNYARVLGVSAAVTFVPALSHRDVAAEMDRADFLLVLSLRMPNGAEEAFSLVAAEGLSMGMPVVATRVGGLPDTVGEGGFLVPPAAPLAAAHVVLDCIERLDPRAIQRRARSWAPRFSMERMSNDYDELALTLLARTDRLP